MPRSLTVPAALLAACAMAATASAQSTPAPSKPNHNTYGSPLDTIMSTHLWTDVAPAKDFVRESRPDPATLDYLPLTGSDPDRPKPRDKANVQALQAELEHDRLDNEAHSRGVKGSGRTGAANKAASTAKNKTAARLRPAASQAGE